MAVGRMAQVRFSVVRILLTECIVWPNLYNLCQVLLTYEVVLGPFLHFYRNAHQFSSLKFSIFDIDGIDLYIVKYRFGSELLDKDVAFFNTTIII